MPCSSCCRPVNGNVVVLDNVMEDSCYSSSENNIPVVVVADEKPIETCHKEQVAIAATATTTSNELLLTRIVSNDIMISSGSSSSNDDDDNDNDSDEIGFLLLRDCTVCVVQNDAAASSEMETGVWMDLSVALNQSSEEEESRKDKQLHDDWSCSNDVCTRCNLVLCHRHASGEEEDDSRNRLVVDNTNSPRFDGTVGDTMSSHSKKCACPKSKQRSDAALLMGLAMTCQDSGYIQIRQMKILIHDKQDKEEDDNKNSSNNRDDDDKALLKTPMTATRRASLLLTIAIPSLTNQLITSSPYDTAVMQNNKTRRKKQFSRAATKLLPPCNQLLLTLVRSDWERLEVEMKQLAKHGVCRNEMQQHGKHGGSSSTTSMFPSTLSLEELYLRLQGVNREEETIKSRRPRCVVSPSCATTTSAGIAEGGGVSPLYTTDTKTGIAEGGGGITSTFLLTLPKDVLVDFVAPYLKAQSLDALRCSCLYLHHSLRSVVPGLKLRLYRHQIKSLNWMRRRETKQVMEHDVLKISGEHDADLHRTVSCGASTRLAFRKQNDGVSTIRIDSQYGSPQRVEALLESNISRKIARGGLLCDDPGLGKTITVLSLVLQTFGLSTKNNNTDTENLKFDPDEIFNAYWKEDVVSIFRRQEYSRLLGRFVKKHKDCDYFRYPVDPVQDKCPDYLDIIEKPICFRDIFSRNAKDEYDHDFGKFCNDVELCFGNAMTYNPPTHPVYQAASRLSAKFQETVQAFKDSQVQSAEQKFSNPLIKPNSRVASILQRRAKHKLMSALEPSSATLLVVPSVLLSHWEEQLRLYVDTSYCTDKIPIIYHHNASKGRRAVKKQTEANVLRLMEQGTHFPLVFIDQSSTKQLPSPEFLAMFRIVITTNQRLSNEWKHGSYENELMNNNRDDNKDEWESPFYRQDPTDACPLLKVHWLRLIVDEGHAMGRGVHNNAIRFASWIEAQRRWAMTGTPTPQTVSQNGLSNLLGLMKFLQHDFFSVRLDGDKIWQRGIVKSWKEGNLAAFFRLKALLLLLMVRHTKSDLEELSPPRYRRTYSIMSQEEVTAYNTLVCAIQSNLITTAMEGKTSGKQDSLLHSRQAKHAREAFSNVRLACTGGTRVVPTLTRKNWDETLMLLESRHGVEPFKRQLVENFMHRAITEQLSGCMCCGLQLSTLMVLPCGDLICTECMDSKTRSCPVCDVEFDVDEFQLLQPGIEYTWKWNLEEEKEKKTRQGLMVPRARVDEVGRIREIQAGPGVGQNGNAGNLGILPIQPLLNGPRTATRRKGDGHTCEYIPAALDGKCKLCLEEHEECVLLSRDSKCHVCFRVPEVCPEEESKFYYLTNKLEQLVADQSSAVHVLSGAASRFIGETVNAQDMTRPIKAIVFSQFRRVLNLVGHRLLLRFGAGCVAEYWGYARKQELAKFTKSRDCFCMLLGKDGSEGLDLSFVTHIFFLDQVWDKALEDQVVARAYRMGAKGHVQVETLVSKNSVEQTMVEMEESIAANRAGMGNSGEFGSITVASSVSDSVKENQSSKLQFLLKNLSLIKNNHFIRIEKNGKRKREAPTIKWGAKGGRKQDGRNCLVNGSTKRVRFMDD